ncbi:MAG: DNA/RNA nuclease SfsA [Alphaproteobacteria bacterium]|nr:DNA/RNA nuclease SfsA [Alphaproteobacteria bacterium]
MEFSGPLVRGTLVQRYKRFLADVTLDSGETITAHCANPGSMIGLQTPGSEVWLSPNQNPKAKLDWRWELIRVDGHLVGVSTSHPNGIVSAAIENGKIAELEGYETQRREVPYGRNSRIDVLLESKDRPPCYVEVKNVNLRRPNGTYPSAAEFPDAVTKRGAKHLVEMTDMVNAGCRAVMFYLVQRDDCDHFRIAADIDPHYAEAFALSRSNRVEAICYTCRMSLDGIELDAPLRMIVD